MNSTFGNQQSKNPEIARNNAEIPYAQETKEHFEKLEKFAQDPEKAISSLAQEKIDQATTGFMEKASEGISKYTPEWLKKIGAFLEKHFSFLGELKDWFGEKIGGIGSWIMGGIGGIFGIDLLKNKEGKGEKKQEVAPSLTGKITENGSIQQAKELLKSKEVVGMVGTMTNFVKKTAGLLDKDLKNNSEAYAMLKDFSVDAMEMISSPIKLIAYFLEKGVKMTQIKEWSDTLKESGEQAFWIAVLGALGYKFVTGGKITKGGIIGFILYGLDKEFTGGEVLKGTFQGVYGIPKEWKNKTGEWMQTLGLKNLGKALQEGEIFDFFREIKEAGIPAVLLGTGSATIAALQVGGRWVFIEPAKAWGEAFTEFFQGEFAEGLQTAMIGQLPIMVSTVAWKYLIKGEGRRKSLTSALDICLPRLLLTHHGHLDMEMAFKNLTNWKTFAYTQETAVNKARYLAKKAAYYQDVDATKFNKIKGELVGLIKNIETNNNNNKWDIKEISGILKDRPGIVINIDTAENLIKDARANWYEKTTLWEKAKNKLRKSYLLELKKGETIIYKDTNGKMLQAEIFEIDPQNPEKLKLKDSNGQTFEIEKKKLTEVKKIKPETFKAKSLELQAKLEEEVNQLGKNLDEAHLDLVKKMQTPNLNKAEETKLVAEFETKKKIILHEIKNNYQKYGAGHLEAFKNKPIGNFGKITMKGMMWTYVGLEGGRIVKAFAQGETKEGIEMAVDLGLRLAPVSGTIMDAQDTWKYLKNGDFKQAGISGAFTVVGGISDFLWVTGIGGAVSRATISGAKVAKIGVKGAKTAKVLSEVEKGKDALKTAQEGIKQGIKNTAQKTGEKIAETTGKITGKLPVRAALKLSTPLLAAYLYQNLKPTEEEIK